MLSSYEPPLPEPPTVYNDQVLVTFRHIVGDLRPDTTIPGCIVISFQFAGSVAFTNAIHRVIVEDQHGVVGRT